MSRNSRLTADVTLEAHNMLREYCDKHERSKGFLLEKIIRKFCADVEPSNPKQEVAIAKPKAPVKRFVPPPPCDVLDYMTERTGLDERLNAEKFNDFYESNGWKVGRNKMKCWKAAVRNWLKGNNNGNKTTKNTSQKLSAHERVKQRNDAKYRQPDECRLGMGANDGHLGRAMDAGEGRATIEHVDNEPFVDY